MRLAADKTLKKSAPWRESLSSPARNALGLKDIHELSERRTDLVVVGGGVAGLSAAMAAAQSGAKVLLLESARTLGEGATGCNAGILSAGVNMPITALTSNPSALALWGETVEQMKELLAQAQARETFLDAAKTGALVLATSKTAAKRLEKEQRARRARNWEAYLCTKDDLSRLTAGHLHVESVECALWLPEEGRVQPLSLLAHLAGQARRAGAQLYGGAKVVSWQEGGRGSAGAGVNGWHLVLEDGSSISTRALVLATGPLEKPTSRIYALSFPINLPESFPLFWDAAPYVYYDYRYGNGRLVISGGRYGQAGSSAADAQFHAKMAAAAISWLPALKSIEPSHAWAVDLHVSADMLPQLTPLGKQGAGYHVDKLGALGVLPGMVLGQKAGYQLVASINGG